MDKVKQIAEIAEEIALALSNGDFSIVEELEAYNPTLTELISKYALLKSMALGIPSASIEVDMIIAAGLVMRLEKQKLSDKLGPSVN